MKNSVESLLEHDHESLGERLGPAMLERRALHDDAATIQGATGRWQYLA